MAAEPETITERERLGGIGVRRTTWVLVVGVFARQARHCGTVRKLARQKHVAFRCLVYEGRFGLSSRFNIGDRLERFVLDSNQFRGVLGDVTSLRNDRCDCLAHIANLGNCERRPVRHPIAGRSGNRAHRLRRLRKLFPRHDRKHARDGARVRSVDLYYPRVRLLGPQEDHVKQT